MKRTPAEEQMEELRRLRETVTKRKPVAPRSALAPSSPAKAALATVPGSTSAGAQGFELSEAQPKKKKKDGPSLVLSAELYRSLLERQRAQRSFKRRKDLGNWAAELVLALPLDAHKLSPEAKAELFKRMQEWAAARGLR